VLGAGALVALAFIVSHASFVPLWDGRFYAECVIDAEHNRLRPYYLRCAGHPSHTYVVLAGLAHHVLPNGSISFVLVDSLLLAAACVGFHRLLRLALPARELDVDRAAATAVFVLQPAFLASALQPNVDLPVLAGFVWCLITLIERRWVWTVLVGLAMVFSKETGVLVYGVMLACYALWLLVRDARPWRNRVVSLVRLAPLAIPLAVFGAYVAAYVVFRPAAPAVWAGETPRATMVRQLLIPRVDDTTAAYLALIFVLNFAWIPALAVAADLAMALRARLAHMKRPAPGIDRSIAALLAIVTVAVVYFLTRFATFTNPRYVLVAVAMLLAVFPVSLIRLGVPVAARRGLLAVYAALLVASTLRTIDPLSRLAFGTFPFGSHDLLRMTSITGECCGPFGRDQLAYNLEFTKFDALISDALATTRDAPAGMPSDIDSLTIVLPDSSDWYVVERLDRTTRRRTLSDPNTRDPWTLVASKAVSRRVRPPPTAWYLALPNQDYPDGLRMLAKMYAIGQERRVERNGYALSIYPLVRADRDAAALGTGSGDGSVISDSSPSRPRSSRDQTGPR
jgi:hypothetical protein